MASINFTGLASGLDTRAIIDAILEFESEPIKQLETRRALFSSRRSALEELRSKIGSFETALRDLSSISTFRGRVANSSDESVLRASASPGAEAGVFDIDITALAEAHKIRSFGFADAETGLVGDGQIQIKSGDNDQITIDVSAASGNNSLNAVRDAINDADAGVQASIIFDGTDYQLTVRAEETGVDNALVVTDGTDLGLTDPGAEVKAAQDAALIIDTIEITSSTNRISGAIPGVNLDLVTEGSSTVEITQDLESIVTATEDLVAEYNDLIEFFSEQGSTGPLAGDTTARAIQSRIQSLFTGGLSGIEVGSIRSLASLGVDFDGKTGNATLDTTELRTLLETNFDEIGDLFLSSNRATDSKIQFIGSGSAVDGQYAVEVTSVAEQASLTGAGPFTTLRRFENLDITLNGVTSTVGLSSGLTPDEVVDEINSQAAIDGVAVTASQVGGVLTVSSDAFGADQELYIDSNRNPSGRQTGFRRSGETDVGADLTGKIGGFDATAQGNLLVGAEGTDVAGLTLQVNATAADVATSTDFGTISFSRGLIETMERQLQSFTRFGDGSLDLARDSLDSSIEQFSDDIARIEERLVTREARLLQQFSAAEQAISLLQNQQASFGATGI